MPSLLWRHIAPMWCWHPDSFFIEFLKWLLSLTLVNNNAENGNLQSAVSNHTMKKCNVKTEENVKNDTFVTDSFYVLQYTCSSLFFYLMLTHLILNIKSFWRKLGLLLFVTNVCLGEIISLYTFIEKRAKRLFFVNLKLKKSKDLWRWPREDPG